MSIFGFGSKKKNTEKLFVEMLQTASQEASQKGPLIMRNQKPASADFGRSSSNPICTKSLASTKVYLSRICTKDKKTFTWSSYTSVRVNIDGIGDVGEDKYTLYLDGKPYADLYFVLYIGESEFPPAGLYFIDDDRDWDMERDALDMGVPVSLAQKIRNAEEEQKRINQKKESERKVQLDNLSLKYPEFNLEIESKNDLFSSLVNLGFDYTTVYEYIHKEELFTAIPLVQVPENNEIYTEDYFYNVLYKIEESKQPKYEDPRQMPKRVLESKAKEEMGVSVDTFVKIRLSEIALAQKNWDEKIKHLSKWAIQAANTKKQFPMFDISVEWQNDLFRKTAEIVGIKVAYEIIHFSELFTLKGNGTTAVNNKLDDNPSEIGELYCRKCGTKLPSDSAFCHRCGAKVITI